MKKFLLIICLIALYSGIAHADTVSINHFVVTESSSAQNEVAVMATDTANHVQESVNGRFSFSINGFDETLKFKRGVAVYHRKLDKSSFLYVKHENETGTHAILYYVYKTSDGFIAVHISWIVLLAIPIILIVLGYMFKKLIIVAAIIFVIFMYFNYHNGLSIPTFFESIIDGLKSMFNKV